MTDLSWWTDGWHDANVPDDWDNEPFDTSEEDAQAEDYGVNGDSRPADDVPDGETVTVDNGGDFILHGTVTGRIPRRCPTQIPEPHEAGEFPMTCYQCHIVADS